MKLLERRIPNVLPSVEYHDNGLKGIQAALGSVDSCRVLQI